MWIILAAAIVPGILLLYYVYSKDFNPEPKRMVYKGFIYGCISVLASFAFSGPLMSLGFFANEPSSLLEAAKTAFFGAAIPEESAKLLMLWLLLRHSPEFDERYDGMVYAASVGLGFACLENLMYVISAGAGWFYVSVTRAIFAVPGHFAFAIIMGYYYSRNHFDWRETTEFDRIKVWLFPVLLHGIYDTLAFSSGIAPEFSGLITILLIYFCIKLFKFTRKRILTEAARNQYESTHNIDDQ